MTRNFDQQQNKMASTARKPPSMHLANPRAVLKTKLTNDVSQRAGGAQRTTSAQVVSGMSPEARAAMLLTREDTRGDNLLSRSRHASLTRAGNNNNNNNSSSITTTNRDKTANTSTRKPAENNMTQTRQISRQKLALPTSGATTTGSDPGSRDASARSRTNKPAFSTSDYNDSGFSSVRNHPLSSTETDNNNNTNNETTQIGSSNNSNNRRQRTIQRRPQSSRISRSQTPSYRRNKRNEADDDDLDDDDDFSPGRTLTNRQAAAARRAGAEESSEDGGDEEDDAMHKDMPKSFVLALDAALEANCISRLRGDITDHAGAGSSAPGTVRALNGGRLSNAQEVVVNVCHGECEKELVFHDDDDDSLDTARAASEIRVNTWLEYNQGFPLEDEEDFEFDGGDEAGDVPDAKPASSPYSSATTTTASQASINNVKPATTTTLRVPTARVKSAVKHQQQQNVINKNQSASAAASGSGVRGGKPPVAGRRDNNNNNSNNSSNQNNSKTTASKNHSNNNSAGSGGRSKSGTTGSVRDNSSSRVGSGVSNDGSSRRSANSSATKRESFLARKARARD